MPPAAPPQLAGGRAHPASTAPPPSSPSSWSSGPLGALLTGSRVAGWVPSYTPALPVLGPYVFPLPISLLPSSLTQASALVSPTPPHPAAPLTPAPPLQAQRNNEDISIITPLFTVSVDHRVSGLKRLAWAREIASTQQASYFGGGAGAHPSPELALLPFLAGHLEWALGFHRGIGCSHRNSDLLPSLQRQEPHPGLRAVPPAARASFNK